MNPDEVVSLVEHRKWVPLAAVVIFFLTRLAKSDIKPLWFDIPPRARIWLVFGLGISSGVLEKVIQGTTWTSAIIGGLVSAVLAMTTHETLIASLRGGKEIVIPGLVVPGVRPSPGAPVSVPPPGQPE